MYTSPAPMGCAGGGRKGEGELFRPSKAGKQELLMRELTHIPRPRLAPPARLAALAVRVENMRPAVVAGLDLPAKIVNVEQGKVGVAGWPQKAQGPPSGHVNAQPYHTIIQKAE